MTFMRQPALERFWERVEKVSGGCWLWQAGLSVDGYGVFAPGDGAPVTKAHRWSYEQAKGPIPAGLQIDHLCRVRNCVNPDHLEAVSQQENMRRGHAAQIHKRFWEGVNFCKRGHEFTEENTCHRKSGRRMCRACNRIRQGKTRCEYVVSNSAENNHVRSCHKRVTVEARLKAQEVSV